MSVRRTFCGCVGIVLLSFAVWAQTGPQTGAPASSQSSSASKHPSTTHVRKPAAGTASALDAGSVSDGVYRNRTFGFSYRIPAGWVLRTEEMNAPTDPDDDAGESQRPQPMGTQGNTVGKPG